MGSHSAALDWESMEKVAIEKVHSQYPTATHTQTGPPDCSELVLRTAMMLPKFLEQALKELVADMSKPAPEERKAHGAQERKQVS